MDGPFSVDWWGDYGYVVNSGGNRVAKCETRENADRVCAALNVAHYLSLAMPKGDAQ